MKLNNFYLVKSRTKETLGEPNRQLGFPVRVTTGEITVVNRIVRLAL